MNKQKLFREATALRRGDIVAYGSRLFVVSEAKTEGKFTSLLLLDSDKNYKEARIRRDELLEVHDNVSHTPFAQRFIKVLGGL